MNTSPPLTARAIALDLYDAAVGQKRPLDQAMASHGGLRALDGRDRAFARNLVLTALRRCGQTSALIDHCLDRPLPKRARSVHHILHLGATQMFFMDVADHAAVSTSVDLARAGGHTAHVKMVNAVLRRLGREGPGLLAAQDAARLNTPDWLWEPWLDAYGEPTCRRIAEAHLAEAPLDISVAVDPEAWAGRLAATVLPNGTLRRTAGGAITELPGFDEGAWWVQDVAARLVVSLLGDVRGRAVIDLCAAPGGKTAHLATAGARVVAVDRSAPRLERLNENLARLGLTADVINADAAEWRPDQPADTVLLDAPCSATGTLRRHPDIAWNKGPDDVASLAATQARLLAAAAEMVKPGGTLLYATCSLQPAEGLAQIAAFLAAQGTFRLDPLTPTDLHGIAAPLQPDGTFRSLPCHMAEAGGMDGFFAARLRRA